MKKKPLQPNLGEELARCLREQRECADYLAGDGTDKAGAMSGLMDWIMEEVLIRLEQNDAGASPTMARSHP